MSDGFKSLAEFWTAQGTALLAIQRNAAGVMAEGMRSVLDPTANPATPEMSQATDALTKLWSAAADLSAEMVGRLGRTGDDAGAVPDVFDPKQWMLGNTGMDDALARMVDGPRLADLFDVERRYGGVMKRWSDSRQRTLEHQRVVLDAWMQAARLYLTEVSAETGSAETLTPKRAVALWTEIANREMLRTQRSEPFLQSQRAMIRADAELRIAQNEMSEHVGKQFGIPTRTEMDDVHRTLTEMRRELRRMRRELNAAKSPSPNAAEASSPDTANASKPRAAKASRNG